LGRGTSWLLIGERCLEPGLGEGEDGPIRTLSEARGEPLGDRMARQEAREKFGVSDELAGQLVRLEFATALGAVTPRRRCIASEVGDVRAGGYQGAIVLLTGRDPGAGGVEQPEVAEQTQDTAR
jgi:hypothetical protein